MDYNPDNIHRDTRLQEPSSNFPKEMPNFMVPAPPGLEKCETQEEARRLIWEHHRAQDAASAS